MATIKRFEDLDVWKVSRQLNKLIGEIIHSGRFQKNFRMIDQMEGASGSIMDNIAEGFERGSTREFIQFLGYSKGSCGEFRSQLYRSLDRGYITREEFQQLFELAIRIGNMNHKLIDYLKGSGIIGHRKNTISKTQTEAKSSDM